MPPADPRTAILPWRALAIALLLGFDLLLVVHVLLPDTFGMLAALFLATPGYTLLPVWPVLAGVALRYGRLALLGAPAALFHLGVLLPGGGVASTPGGHVVLTANTLYQVEDVGPMAAQLLDQPADIVAIQEFTPALEAALAGSSLPFRYLDAQPGPTGMAIFSRFPLEDVRTREDRRWVRARIDGWAVYVVHTSPPLSAELTRQRVEQLARLASEIRQETEPVVVLGDLNIGPDSPSFLAFLRQAGLVDVVDRCARGWTGTWGPPALPALIRLDHVLVSEALTCGEVTVLPRAGSDHAPILAHLVQQDP